MASLTAPKDRVGKYTEVNGARIFYEVSGRGPAMLLLHGYPLSGALFARNRDALSEQVDFLTQVIEQCSQDGAIGGAKALAGRPDSTDLLSQIMLRSQLGPQHMTNQHVTKGL